MARTDQSLPAKRAYAVVAAATGINLALGVLYSWSIFKQSIQESLTLGSATGESGFQWNPGAVNDPYALACLVFAFCMIPAGRMQDRLGPRLTALSGGVLVSLGFLVISLSQSYWIWLFGFGVMVGAGIAFGYSAATPAALKWFSPARSGLIAGIVVSGFGLAPAYIAPLSNWLVGQHGLLATMKILGVGFLVIVSLLAFFLRRPPESYQPSARLDARSLGAEVPQPKFSPAEVLNQWRFWALWVMYFIGAGAGLMIIGSISVMAQTSMAELAFLTVAILAIGNALGRVVLGQLGDRYGRTRILAFSFLFQALCMFAAAAATPDAGALWVVLLATLIGFNYGANLAIFPSITKVLWGMPHFGVNYGMLFTAWGFGGFFMIKFSESLKVASGDYFSSFMVAGILLVVGAGIGLYLHRHKQTFILSAQREAATIARG